MDLSKFANPYDFANPVVESDLFVGRDAEMDEIKYYLEHASKASRPIHLAVMGERASGKTSVLNMAQIEAEKRGFCVVRVDLDEADAETHLAFFYKIFDSVLTTACKAGAFGELTGKTYECYRNMVDAYEIPEDKRFCSFIFPIQYANAMSKGNVTAALSDTGFKEDMNNIRTEVNRPIAVLFDECDVLTKSRVHLEKLRNIFMNTPGFMLIVTGTPALFPLMDDVFSPIVRQFKKIPIGPFEEEETGDCVRKPLEKIGLTRPSEIFDFETYRDVRLIHDLSGGRPYEIQLICHLLFRRVQEGRAKRMKLTLDVLDDVLKELRTSQDVSIRPVLSAIRNFDKKELSALGLLCLCSGRANFEQIWFAEYVLQGEKQWRKELLQEHLRKLEELGVVTIKNDLISFAGDDFDRVYCKYLARKHGVPLSITDLPYEIYVALTFHSFLQGELKGIQAYSPVSIGELDKLRAREIAMALLDDSEVANPFQSTPDAAEELYWACIHFRDGDSFQIVTMVLTTPWTTVRLSYTSEDPKKATQLPLDELMSILEDPSRRAVANDGELMVETHTVPVVPVETLARKVEQSDNTRMRKMLSQQHLVEMIEVYTEQHDIEEALFHGKLGYRCDPDPRIANNLGYLFLVSDNLQSAKDFLKKAAMDHETPKDQALPNYNLGVLEAKEGSYESALAQFKLAIEQVESAGKGSVKCSCLLLPHFAEEERRLNFQEVPHPDLLETAQSAASAIQKLLGKE